MARSACCPSAESAIELIWAPYAVLRCNTAPVAVSHRRRTPSRVPVNSQLPSRDSARLRTGALWSNFCSASCVTSQNAHGLIQRGGIDLPAARGKDGGEHPAVCPCRAPASSPLAAFQTMIRCSEPCPAASASLPSGESATQRRRPRLRAHLQHRLRELHVPQSDAAVNACRQETLAFGIDRRGRHLLVMALKSAGQLSGGGIPEAQVLSAPQVSTGACRG